MNSRTISTDENRKRWLLLLIAIDILVSLGHYAHNIAFLPEYREPVWITPMLIDALWFVMTPFACVGYAMFARHQVPLAYVLIYIYCGLSLLVLGHYLITPPWTLSPTINGAIALEAIGAAILAIYTVWLQMQGVEDTNL